MEIWTKTYSAAEVAEAANIAPATLQNWLKRGVIVGHRGEDIEGGGVKGRHRRFSFYAVMQISIANALVEAGGGMDIKQAFEAAMIFAHSGYAAPHCIGDDEAERHPGHPYHFSFGETLMATAGGVTTVVLHKPDGDTFGKIRNNLKGATGFVVINAGDIFDRTCAALGEHPNEVMNAAYPKAAVA